MTREYPEQSVFDAGNGWYWRWRRRNGKWGGLAIHRIASFSGRGGVIRIAGYGALWKDRKAPHLDVHVSDAGHSIHVYLNGVQMIPGDSE